MRSNPYPFHSAFHFSTDGAVAGTYADGKTLSTSAEPFEIQAGMRGILAPKKVVLPSQIPNAFRQGIMALPKAFCGTGSQFTFSDYGQERREPSLASASASANRKSNRPAAASASIRWPQESSRISTNLSVSSQNSSRGNAAIACSISCTVLMAKI